MMINVEARIEATEGCSDSEKEITCFYDVHMITMIVYCCDGSYTEECVLCIVATSAGRFVSGDQQTKQRIT